jgi:hypothetical protein
LKSRNILIYLLSLHLGKAVTAIYRSVRLGLEGNSCLSAACSTGSGKELAGTACVVLAGVAAGLATLGLILESALCIKFLLTSGKHEFCSTFFAY